MAEARALYQRNERPSRLLAASGIVLLKVVFVITHWLVLLMLLPIAAVTAYVGYLFALIEGRVPKGVHRTVEIYLRWQVRVWGYVAGITDEYPPFETEIPGYGLDGELPRSTRSNRWWALGSVFGLRVVAALPHLLALPFLGIGAVVAAWLGYWSALLTGRVPTVVQDYIAGVAQWWLRTFAFIFGLNGDNYPRFTLAVSPS